MKTMLLGAAIFAATLITGISVRADTTMGQSNDPRAELHEQMDAELGLARVAPVQHERIIVLKSPRPLPRPLFTPGFNEEDWLSYLPLASGGAAWSCLAQALYFEARGESVTGMVGVAEVILNRVDHARYPDTVCGVVNQGTGRKHRCQFSYACDGKSEAITERSAYVRVGKIARVMLDGAPRALTAGATHYHTSAVAPRWAKRFDQTATIGVHRFYRLPLETAQR